MYNQITAFSIISINIHHSDVLVNKSLLKGLEALSCPLSRVVRTFSTDRATRTVGGENVAGVAFLNINACFSFVFQLSDAEKRELDREAAEMAEAYMRQMGDSDNYDDSFDDSDSDSEEEEDYGGNPFAGLETEVVRGVTADVTYVNP